MSTILVIINFIIWLFSLIMTTLYIFDPYANLFALTICIIIFLITTIILFLLCTNNKYDEKI